MFPRALLPLIFLLCFAIPALSTAQSWVPKPPTLSAQSYILVDYSSGDILASKDPDARYEPASLTKLMTAYVAYQALADGLIKNNDRVTISTKAWRTKGSRTFLKEKSKVPLDVLLSGIVVQSGNDASVALAEHIAGSEESFVDMMNMQAQRLGMRDSNFVNSTGLPAPGHVMTAKDIAILSRALIRDFPGHYKMYAERAYTYNDITQRNRNTLLWHNIGVDGLKTGYTESAGYCLAASAVQNDMRLISVVLNGPSEQKRFTDSAELLRYGFRFYRSARLFTSNEAISETRAWGGEPGLAKVGVLNDVYAAFPKNAAKKIRTEITIREGVNAPIEQHSELGTVQVYLGDKLLQQQPLVALNEIKKGDTFTRLSDSFLRLFE